MKSEIVLVITAIVLVNASKHVNDIEVMTQTEDTVTHLNSSEEVQPFQNLTQTDVASMNSTDVRRNNSAFDDKMKLRKPLRLKIIPIIKKIGNKNYWKTATTRKALMKHTKFTIKPLTMLKLPENVTRYSKNETVEKGRTTLFNKILGAPKNDDSSEEISDGSSTNENKSDSKSVHLGTTLPSFKQALSRVNSKTKKAEHVVKSKKGDIEPHKNKIKGKNKVSVSEFSSEEREDREEFIFVTPAVINKSSEESEETATIFEAETKIKHRRSINVIEEENLGTTVSGFKFTGKVETLNSDLTFKNINN